MNNTHKLLLAFIEASGYEVEEVRTNSSEVADYKARRDDIKARGMVGLEPIGNRPKPIIDYKVTKKKSGNSPEGRKTGLPDLPTLRGLYDEFSKDHQL